MQQLIAKLQYKDFEPGEFVEARPRTYDEVIALAENFPWQTERDHIQIGLTNPSITIEGANNDFLKLALFYNGKFVLHYFDKDQNLYTKSFTQCKDSYAYIETFFNSRVFDPKDLRKEITWLQRNRVHFLSQDFRYEITLRSSILFLLKTSVIQLGCSVAIIFALLIEWPPHPRLSGIVFALAFMFVLGGGINLLLFLNYLLTTGKKCLVMSKGNDVFYFGNKDAPEQYNKKDIDHVVIIENRNNTRNPIYGFAITRIYFRDCTSISIPSLLVSEDAMRMKLQKCDPVSQHGFPFLRHS